MRFILLVLPYLIMGFNGGIKDYELDDTRCKSENLDLDF